MCSSRSFPYSDSNYHSNKHIHHIHSLGVMCSSRSFPYRGSPASSLRASRAPSPARRTRLSLVRTDARDSVFLRGTEISKPSSPAKRGRGDGDGERWEVAGDLKAVLTCKDVMWGREVVRDGMGWDGV